MIRRSNSRTARPIRLIAIGVASLALSFALGGCATTSDEASTEDTGSEFDAGDTSNQQPVVEEVQETTVAETTMLDLKTVYFDFDRSNIRADQRPVAQANGEQLRTSGVDVRLEGYCDERGDEEYNLALGERRANSVKSYLVSMGVDAGQMRTVSYGEANPAVAGHDESAWKWNRRVEFHQQ